MQAMSCVRTGKTGAGPAGGLGSRHLGNESPRTSLPEADRRPLNELDYAANFDSSSPIATRTPALLLWLGPNPTSGRHRAGAGRKKEDAAARARPTVPSPGGKILDSLGSRSSTSTITWPGPETLEDAAELTTLVVSPAIMAILAARTSANLYDSESGRLAMRLPGRDSRTVAKDNDD